MDYLVQKGVIKSQVIAQIGQSDYIPRNYEYIKYLTPQDFSDLQDKASMIITHGGTGAIISALKKKKKVVVVPRLSKYKEHTDNHQIEVSLQLKDMGYLEVVEDIIDLELIIEKANNKTYNYFKSEANILNILKEYIEQH